MTFEQAIERLSTKLPKGMRFRLERRGGRMPRKSRKGKFLGLRPFDIFRLVVEAWEEFPRRVYRGRWDRLDQGLGAAVDQVLSWRATGVIPVKCVSCWDTGVVEIATGTKTMCPN